MEEELAETQLRNKRNKEFEAFVSKTEQASAQSGFALEFENTYPFSSFALQAVHFFECT